MHSFFCLAEDGFSCPALILCRVRILTNTGSWVVPQVQSVAGGHPSAHQERRACCLLYRLGCKESVGRETWVWMLALSLTSPETLGTGSERCALPFPPLQGVGGGGLKCPRPRGLHRSVSTNRQAPGPSRQVASLCAVLVLSHHP